MKDAGAGGAAGGVGAVGNRSCGAIVAGDPAGAGGAARSGSDSILDA